MSEESVAKNPYEEVLADLRAKRAEIDNTIKVLESLSGLKLTPTASGGLQFGPAQDADAPAAEEAAGMYLGMSITDATKKLLAQRKRKMGNVEIARELQAGGLALSSKDPVNTIGSVLTRRFNEVGDVVKVGRGIWGLKEWYPGRSFKPASKGNTLTMSADTAEAVGDAVANLLGENPLSRALSPGYPDNE